MSAPKTLGTFTSLSCSTLRRSSTEEIQWRGYFGGGLIIYYYFFILSWFYFWKQFWEIAAISQNSPLCWFSFRKPNLCVFQISGFLEREKKKKEERRRERRECVGFLLENQICVFFQISGFLEREKEKREEERRRERRECAGVCARARVCVVCGFVVVPPLPREQYKEQNSCLFVWSKSGRGRDKHKGSCGCGKTGERVCVCCPQGRQVKDDLPRLEAQP